MYFDVPVHMFISDFNWYDPTFGQFIVLNIVAIYVFGLIMALLAMAFTSIVPNYIVLKSIQIPIIAGLVGYGTLYLITNIIAIWIPQSVVPTKYTSTLLIDIGLLMHMWKREINRKILE